MKISDGSGLPEPENPTGFGRFLQTRTYPNPKIPGLLKPEATRTRIFWDFLNPKLPEPEVQTRGYLMGLETLKLATNWPKKPLRIALKSPKYCPIFNAAMTSRHFWCVRLLK